MCLYETRPLCADSESEFMVNRVQSVASENGGLRPLGEEMEEVPESDNSGNPPFLSMTEEIVTG